MGEGQALMKKLKIQTIKHIDDLKGEAGIDSDYFTTPCICTEEKEKCGWYGIIKDCNVRYESESWEYPHEYEILTCPKCGQDVDY
jgi:hypothetical protein